jgi:hypothetical protein
MNIRYVVELTERDELRAVVVKGSQLARKVKRAQILLAADAGSIDEEIARNVVVGTSTVSRPSRHKRRPISSSMSVSRAWRPRPRPRVARAKRG